MSDLQKVNNSKNFDWIFYNQLIFICSIYQEIMLIDIYNLLYYLLYKHLLIYPQSIFKFKAVSCWCLALSTAIPIFFFFNDPRPLEIIYVLKAGVINDQVFWSLKAARIIHALLFCLRWHSLLINSLFAGVLCKLFVKLKLIRIFLIINFYCFLPIKIQDLEDK